MSHVFNQRISQSSAKFVLLAIANCADGKDFFAWPSVAYLSEMTGQDRKTVILNIKRLIEIGYLQDTGERRGSTKQVVVYQIIRDVVVPETVPKKEYQKRNGSKNGTVPNFPDKSTVFPYKESRFSVERVPKTGHGTIKETSGNHQETINNLINAPPEKISNRSGLKPEDLIALGVDSQVAKDFLTARKTKFTPTALTGFQREATKAGISLGEAMRISAERGWQSFKAEWINENCSGNTASTGKPKGFEYGDAVGQRWLEQERERERAAGNGDCAIGGFD